jgi:hypothetical protein
MVLLFFIVLIKAFIYVNTRYELTIFIIPDNSLFKTINLRDCCNVSNSLTTVKMIPNQLHEAESVRSQQSLSYSRFSQHFMAPEVSLPCLQEPTACYYPETDNADQTTPSYLSKIYFNTILEPTSKFAQWPLSFWFSYQNPICILLFPPPTPPPNAYYIHCLSHSP